MNNGITMSIMLDLLHTISYIYDYYVSSVWQQHLTISHIIIACFLLKRKICAHSSIFLVTFPVCCLSLLLPFECLHAVSCGKATVTNNLPVLNFARPEHRSNRSLLHRPHRVRSQRHAGRWRCGSPVRGQ